MRKVPQNNLTPAFQWFPKNIVVEFSVMWSLERIMSFDVVLFSILPPLSFQSFPLTLTTLFKLSQRVCPNCHHSLTTKHCCIPSRWEPRWTLCSCSKVYYSFSAWHWTASSWLRVGSTTYTTVVVDAEGTSYPLLYHAIVTIHLHIQSPSITTLHTTPPPTHQTFKSQMVPRTLPNMTF